MRIVSDDDVRTVFTPELAITAARTALVDANEGRLAGVPRLIGDGGAADLAFTVGGYREGPVGFRAYVKWRPLDYHNQVMVVWNIDHTIKAIAVGREIGARRTASMGAVAMDLLARPDATSLAVVGTGYQAWMQLWCSARVRDWQEIRVFRRNADEREAFAKKVRDRLGLPCRPVASAREAVDGVAAVLLSTGSKEPVVEASWLAPGTHLSSLSMTSASHEVPTELVSEVRVVVSDSPSQSFATDEFGLLKGREVVHLGAVVADPSLGRRDSQEKTLFWSAGLAGSEVVAVTMIADMLEAHAGAHD